MDCFICLYFSLRSETALKRHMFSKLHACIFTQHILTTSASLVITFSCFSLVAPSKQSVFPSGGNILKKKARSTLLSVLTKRQAQEKFFLGDKTDGREQQNSTVSSVEQSLHQPKWSSEAMIVDLGADLESTKSKPQRPGAVEAKSLSCYPFETSNPNRASLTSNDKVSRAKSNEQIDEKSTHFVENAVVEQDLEQNTNESKLSSRLPHEPLYLDRDQTDPSFQSLGNRRNFAPRHLPCQDFGDVSQAMVVSMSPSYTSVKDITPSSPLSPKSVSDSVKVSIPFQVHGQQQSSKPEQQPSHVWSSTVSVCVPFQVNEHGASVPVSCSFDNQLLPTSLLDEQTTQQVPCTSSVPFLQEPLNSPSSNTVSVSAPTVESDTENGYSSAMGKMSSSEPLFQMKSSSFLSPDDVETGSQDMTDGGVSTKPRSHSSPAPGKRKPKGRYSVFKRFIAGISCHPNLERRVLSNIGGRTSRKPPHFSLTRPQQTAYRFLFTARLRDNFLTVNREINTNVPSNRHSRLA